MAICGAPKLFKAGPFYPPILPTKKRPQNYLARSLADQRCTGQIVKSRVSVIRRIFQRLKREDFIRLTPLDCYLQFFEYNVEVPSPQYTFPLRMATSSTLLLPPGQSSLLTEPPRPQSSPKPLSEAYQSSQTGQRLRPVMMSSWRPRREAFVLRGMW